MREYTIVSAPQAETLNTEFNMTAATLSHIVLLSVEIGQTTEEADAQDEMLNIKISRFRGGFTIGSGGAAATPGLIDPIDSAASFTARVSDTTATSGGSEDIMRQTAFNVRQGYLWVPLKVERLEAESTDAFAILIEAPADSVSYVFTATLREFGT